MQKYFPEPPPVRTQPMTPSAFYLHDRIMLLEALMAQIMLIVSVTERQAQAVDLIVRSYNEQLAALLVKHNIQPEASNDSNSQAVPPNIPH